MARLDTNPTDPTTGGDWWSQNAPPPTPSWLPEGATLNPDGSVTLANGNVVAAPPPGYTRDPQTGVISRTGPDNPDQGALKPYQAPTPGPIAPPPNPIAPPPGGGITSPGAPIGVPTSGFGAAPTPYTSDPNAPTYEPLPPYTPPTWTGGDYQNPTEQDLFNSPGYQARMDAVLRSRNRSAAAQGTVLNGGTVAALGRDAQTFASNEYQNLRNNTFEAYKQRYAQFQDAAGMDLGARTLNANANQSAYANRTAAYVNNNTRTLSDYLTNYTGKRNSELDYWNRLQDVTNTGANLAGGSR